MTPTILNFIRRGWLLFSIGSIALYAFANLTLWVPDNDPSGARSFLIAIFHVVPFGWTFFTFLEDGTV